MIIKPCRCFLPAKLAQCRAVNGARQGTASEGTCTAGPVAAAPGGLLSSAKQTTARMHVLGLRVLPALVGNICGLEPDSDLLFTIPSALMDTLLLIFSTESPAFLPLLALLLCVHLDNTGHFPNLLSSTCP